MQTEISINRPVNRLDFESQPRINHEIVQPKKPNSDANAKDFTCKQAQTINSNRKESNLNIKINNFEFTDLKMEKQFNYGHHHLGQIKKWWRLSTK